MKQLKITNGLSSEARTEFTRVMPNREKHQPKVNFGLRIVIISILGGILLSGCSLIKNMSDHRTPGEKSWDKAIAEAPQFDGTHWKGTKFKLNFNGQEFSSTGDVRIIRDSALHISLTPFFGMEMFKVELTKTQLAVFDKVHTRLYKIDYARTDSLSGLSWIFSHIQDALSDRPFVFAPNAHVVKKYSTEKGKDIFEMDRERLTQKIVLNDKFRMESMEVAATENDWKFGMDYADFQEEDGIVFPKQMALSIQLNNFSVNVTMGLRTINFRTYPELRFENPSKYTESKIPTQL